MGCDLDACGFIPSAGLLLRAISSVKQEGGVELRWWCAGGIAVTENLCVRAARAAHSSLLPAIPRVDIREHFAPA